MEFKGQDDIYELIAKYLEDMADSVETSRLKKWIGSSEENKQCFEQVKNIWDAADKRIDPNKINVQKALEKVLYQIPKVAAKKTFWYYWQKIAAILILPLVFSTFIWIYLRSQNTDYFENDVYNEIYAAFGTRSSLRLADSTLVWLNSGSSLRYPVKFNNKVRKVFLKGEAYFEVKSDISRPFIVETPTIEVKATGTKFNVQEYDSHPVIEVTLISGKVFVSERTKDLNSQLISELNPDQHLVYYKQTKTKKMINVDASRYIAWKNGTLVFRNEPLSIVLDKLGKIFNVEFELRGKDLQDYRYRATFQDESLEEILKLLKLSSPIDFLEVKRIPLPDGTFPKKKVIIFPAKHTFHNENI